MFSPYKIGALGSLRAELGLWVSFAGFSILILLGLVSVVLILVSWLVLMLGSFLAAWALNWCLKSVLMSWLVLMLESILAAWALNWCLKSVLMSWLAFMLGSFLAAWALNWCLKSVLISWLVLILGSSNSLGACTLMAWFFNSNCIPWLVLMLWSFLTACALMTWFFISDCKPWLLLIPGFSLAACALTWCLNCDFIPRLVLKHLLLVFQLTIWPALHNFLSWCGILCLILSSFFVAGLRLLMTIL